MKRLCYISRNYRGISSAGNKAKTDYENTLRQLGAVNLGLSRTLYRNKILTFILNLAGVLKYAFCVRKEDLVFLQYPVKKYFVMICLVAQARGAKTIVFIHDLGSFRRKKFTVQQEIKKLKHADYIIAANPSMQQWLKEHGYTNPLGNMGLHDYHSEAFPCPYCDVCECKRIVYAGSLSMRKNSFLASLSEQILSYQLQIYGNSGGLSSLKNNPQICMKNFLPADDFIRTVSADFGLVWDGQSIHGCTGDFGEYLQYNSPHKVSFYLCAGLPVIIWRKAALAQIIEREGIGLCIDSLEELNHILPSITNEHMNRMRENVQRVGQHLRNAGSLRSALEQAIGELDR